MTFISRLPDEILLHIIKNTNRHDYFAFSIVNSKFYQLTKPLLYQSIFIQDQDQVNGFLDRISTPDESMGQWIHQVDLQDVPVTDPQLMTIMEHTPSLASFVLGDARHISDATMQYVPHYWSNLNRLGLTHCPISTAMYRILCQQCTHLSTMTLWACPGLESDTFSPIHFHNTRLKRLEIATFMDNDDQHDWMVNDETTINLIGFRGLTHLVIHEAPFGMLYLPLITAAAAAHEDLFCWPFLTFLSLDGLFHSTDDDILPLLFGFPPLKSLVLKDGTALTDLTLDRIGQHQPQLIELDISFCTRITKTGICRLIHQCRHLSLITLTYCGFMMNDFNGGGVGPQCAGLIKTTDNITHTALDHLDDQAIHHIRDVYHE